ncbi:glycosyltransferase family 2 protein [Rhodococcus sp. HNM0563]|uniref:glycosyltransferase n=1 Tax=unclassified Rhodococcus (in: high G+C Gram-positive bacteria) TaxID=192944 RepID=UPI00146CAF55|nr:MULTISPECIES: glycosyltransferase [unclassified Rhodococcus (in: high G+C Gram-positive bacteria)]MCK0091239.1 glycosyltransferase [Rhodococcus sp. F64268]NLU63891.1 glycosyltransferase family 2 protein [Rhodococcus sp. HNM0563]
MEQAPAGDTTTDGSNVDALEEALIEPARRDRLIVQRGLFGSLSPRVPEKMYVVTKGDAAADRHGLQLAEGATAHTNTYFGRFAATFWQRWTDVKTVNLQLTYASSGSAAFTVWASDARGRERIVTTSKVSGSGDLDLELPIERFVDGGAMWFSVESSNGSLLISDARWTVAAPEHLRPAAVVICTFNRADDCTVTVGTLASDDDAMADIDAVCIVDQGTDQVRSRPSFAEVEEKLGKKLIYLTQPNLGGAGGFSRGMYEITGSPNSAHANVIVMDDDILCEPESVLRLNAFANMTVQPTIVGAQMLSLSNPQILHVSAEREVLDEITAGELTPGAKMGIDLIKKKQDPRFDAGWNGWWTCLLPAEIIAECGLPIPLFFQWDDIEYGIRARFAGHPTVTLPNAGVWHADFHLKDYDDWARYFSIRNGLVVSALYGRFDGNDISKYLFRKISELIVSMQYGLAATFIKAAEDFLAGPDFLYDGGQSVLKELRELRDRYPETKPLPASQVGKESDPHTQMKVWDFEPDKKREGLVLVKRAVQQFRGKVDRRQVTVPAHFANWWHVSLFDTAVVTDASQNAVRVRRRDKDIAVALAKHAAKVCWQLRKEAPQMKKTWHDAMPKLTSRENWARLYGIGE